jgi:hypothetical protein
MEAVMGVVKQGLIEDAESERKQEIRDHFKDKHGRWPYPAEMSNATDDYELDEAFDHAMGSD